MPRLGPWFLALAVGLALLGHGQGPTAAADEGPARTLAQLIERYDSTACRQCHGEIYDQWAGSHHARPLMGLNNFSFMSKYLRKGPLAVRAPGEATLANFACAKCHLPQLLEAGDQVAKELAEVIWRDDKATLAKLNIGCLVCHRDKAVAHHEPRAGELHGPRGLEGHEGAFGRVRRSGFMSSPAFCGQCHGLGPNFEFTPPVQCATLYGSYLHAYVANGGARTCNDCHMPGGDHGFPPNFAQPDQTAALYRAALPLTVEALAYTFHPGHEQYSPLVVVGVAIGNNAGHRLPDG